MTPKTLVETLLTARLSNRLGQYTKDIEAWSHETRTQVLDTIFDRLWIAEPELQVMLYQVGRGIVHERPAPFANRVLTVGGSDALLAEVCWSIEGWADAASVPLLVNLVRSERSLLVRRQALLALLFTQDACVPAVLAEVAAWTPTSPEEQELVEFVRELQTT